MCLRFIDLELRWEHFTYEETYNMPHHNNWTHPDQKLRERDTRTLQSVQFLFRKKPYSTGSNANDEVYKSYICFAYLALKYLFQLRSSKITWWRKRTATYPSKNPNRSCEASVSLSGSSETTLKDLVMC